MTERDQELRRRLQVSVQGPRKIKIKTYFLLTDQRFGVPDQNFTSYQSPIPNNKNLKLI